MKRLALFSVIRNGGDGGVLRLGLVAVDERQCLLPSRAPTTCCIALTSLQNAVTPGFVGRERPLAVEDLPWAKQVCQTDSFVVSAEQIFAPD